MTQPNIVINWMAIGAALITTFIFGYLWYGPFFGKIWAKEMGMSPDHKPSSKEFARAMILQVVGLFLTIYVVAKWPLAFIHLGADKSTIGYGCMCAFVTWVGFFLPQDLNKVAWEKGTWKLFAINATYHFLNLFIICQILTRCCR